MPSDPEYTLSELAAIAAVPPRTIRYYVAQGLLPSPEGAGPATRYPAHVLARLKLIKQLQRQHLPLAEIRRQLAALSDDEALELAATPEPTPPGSALEYVRSLLAPEPRMEPHPRFRLHEPDLLRELRIDDYGELPPPAMPPPAMPPPAPMTVPPGTPTSATSPTASSAAVEPPTGPAPTTPAPERSQWERIVLEPDVELHVRRPLTRIANKRVERLVTFARQLLEEDQP